MYSGQVQGEFMDGNINVSEFSEVTCVTMEVHHEDALGEYPRNLSYFGRQTHYCKVVMEPYTAKKLLVVFLIQY